MHQMEMEVTTLEESLREAQKDLEDVRSANSEKELEIRKLQDKLAASKEALGKVKDEKRIRLIVTDIMVS